MALEPFDDIRPRYERGTLYPAIAGGRMLDEFARYDLPRDVDAPDHEIADRLSAIKHFWDSVDTSGVGTDGFVLRTLLAEHQALSEILTSSARRRDLKSRLDERDAVNLEQARRAIAGQIESFRARGGGTLPRSLRESIDPKVFANRYGLRTHEVDALLDGYSWSGEPETAGDQPGPALNADTINRIREALVFLERETGEAGVGRSLFSFLRIGPDAGPEEIERALGERRKQVRQTSDKALKLALQSLVSHATERLVQASDGGAAYREALVTSAIAGLEAELRVEHQVDLAASEPVLIDTATARRLEAGAVDLGVPRQRAEAAVAAAARAAGCAVERQGGPRPAIHLCPGCQGAIRGDRPKECPRCGVLLFGACPRERCSAEVTPDMASCEACGHDLRRHRILGRGIAEVRAALRDGDHALAARRIEAYGLTGEDGPQARALLDEVVSARTAISRLVATAEAAAGERRWVAARDAFQEAARLDANYPATGGTVAEMARTAGRVVMDVAGQLGKVGGPAVAPESLVARLEGQCADHPEIIEWLRAHPPTPARGVTAAVVGSDVLVRWQPSASAGVEGYEVLRHVSVDGERPRRDSLGVVARPALDDAGVPAGANVHYVVTAIRAGTRSPASRSPALTPLPDPVGVRVDGAPGEVTIRWTEGPSVAARVVEVLRLDGADQLQIPVEGDVATDRAVTPGETYTYLVRYRYTLPDGAVVTTTGARVVRRAPRELRPINALLVSYRDPSTIELHATPSVELEVGFALVVADRPPALGEAMTLQELEQSCRIIARGQPHATVPAPALGQVERFVAFTIEGETCRIGAAASAAGLAPLPHVRLSRLGPLVRVGIPWGELADIPQVMIGWSFDRRPRAIDDCPPGQRRRLRRNEPFEGIRAESQRGLHVVAAPAMRLGADDVLGPATHATAD